MCRLLNYMAQNLSIYMYFTMLKTSIVKLNIDTMKRITFLAIIAALFTINAAKAQVGVHVGLNFGTPYYHHYHARPVAYAQPAYYPPAYPVYPTYYNSYYRRPVYSDRGYYGPRRVAYHADFYHSGYRRW